MTDDETESALPEQDSQLRELGRSLGGRELDAEVLGADPNNDIAVLQGASETLASRRVAFVLVEVGFLSNPQEERMLSDSSYRQQIAEMLFESLNRYRRRQDSLIGGGSRR